MTRHRRLLLAYPLWHRQLHGDDMLTMLGDAAADGRPVREAAFVLDGLRCRLRVRGAAAITFALLAGVVAAGFGAAAAGWAAWQVTARPMPTVAQATALAAPVLPPGLRGRPNQLSGVDQLLVPIIGDPEWSPPRVEFATVRPAPPSLDAARRTAQASLTAAGWRTRSQSDLVVGERDGWRTTVLIGAREQTTSDLIVTVQPVPPPAVYNTAALGAALAALTGWLMAAAGISRARRLPARRRFRTRSLGVIAIAAALPVALINLVATALADADAAAAPPWLGFLAFFTRPTSALGVVLLIVALRQSTRARTDDSPAEARLA